MSPEQPSRAAVTAIVAALCEKDVLPGQTPYIRYLESIADNAAKLMTAYMTAIRGFVSPQDRAVVESAYCAGMLHDAMEKRSMQFEQLVEIANLETAEMVSYVSSDIRVAAPVRSAELVCRIGASPAHAQIVALAKFRGEADLAMYRANKTKSKEALQFLDNWEFDFDKLLGAIVVVRRVACIEAVVRAIRADIQRTRDHAIRRRKEAIRKETARAIRGNVTKRKPKPKRK